MEQLVFDWTGLTCGNGTPWLVCLAAVCPACQREALEQQAGATAKRNSNRKRRSNAVQKKGPVPPPQHTGP